MLYICNICYHGYQHSPVVTEGWCSNWLITCTWGVSGCVRMGWAYIEQEYSALKVANILLYFKNQCKKFVLKNIYKRLPSITILTLLYIVREEGCRWVIHIE